MLFERGVRDHLSFIIHKRKKMNSRFRTPSGELLPWLRLDPMKRTGSEFVQLLSKICPRLPEIG